jgi:hypothetical protein
LGTADDFVVKIPPLTKVGQVSLLSASIPNTLYNITALNNTIYWTRGGALSVTIPTGAYSVTDLCLVLATAMDAADGVETYQVSYSPANYEAEYHLHCSLLADLYFDHVSNVVRAGL